MVWLGGLDIPIVQFFEAGFAENDSRKSQPVQRAEGTSLARFGSALLPLDSRSPFGATSPIFSYPYARTRDALEHLARTSAPDPHRGLCLRYANPLTGGHAMPTIAAWMQWLPAGFGTQPWRSTAGAVYSVVEGRLRATVTQQGVASVFEAGPRDHFVVPPWATLELQADSTAVLFGYSDAPLQQAAGLLREEAL